MNNPASAEGFTVIFSNARDEKKGGAAGTAGNGQARGNKNNSTKSGHSNDSQVVTPFPRNITFRNISLVKFYIFID